MYILGISCYYHDATAAIVKEGDVIAAAQEERFSRIKHDHRFPEKAINFCLSQANITIKDIDYVAFYEKPAIKLDRVLGTLAKHYPKSKKIYPLILKNWGKEKAWIREIIKSRLGVPDKKILFSEHHLSHAANAFYLSPFTEASILTVDGVGEWVTTSFGKAGFNKNITRFSYVSFPHSLGLFYSAFTEFLGFEVNEGEYKVMGMAPYGTPRYLDKVEKMFLSVSDFNFELDMDYFAYEYSPDTNLTSKFISLWGEKRERDEPFCLPVADLAEESKTAPKKVVERSRYYADIAASVQLFTENLLVRFVKALVNQTECRNLCFAGGVANNSAANGRIIRECSVNLFVPPGPGDSGAAIGAALEAYRLINGSLPKKQPLMHAYLGKAYSNTEIHKLLNSYGYKYEHFSSEKQLTEEVSEMLAHGKVVGWLQGRFEFGPRALGARSILADPRENKMKKVVNERIKYRELFRPFAPSCIEEKADEYYEFASGEKEQFPYRFMQSVVPVKKDKISSLQATTHVDNSARLQIVRKETNPIFYELIKNFGDQTGVYVLLNTSFNRRGEPIVASPEDAISTFEWSGLDALVLGEFLLKR